jgi:NADH-quinone oxidoreductase subunit J
MLSLFNYFIFLQVFTSTFIYFSVNPIHSILLLILLFFESSIVLSLFNLEFISILFILIYVGAIAILFLFVVMMLQLKLNDLEILFFLPFVFGFNFLFFIYLFTFYHPYKYNFLYQNFSEFVCFDVVEESFTEIFVIGQFLYNYALLCFLLAGIILLLALLGSIVLSLEYNKLNFVIISRKLIRSSNFVSFFK